MMLLAAQDASSAEIVFRILKSGTQTNATLKVSPKDGTVFNKDAPWELNVKEPEGNPRIFGAKDFDFRANSFSFPILDPKTDSKNIEYRLVYFVCNLEKTWCKRLIYKNK